MRVDAWRLIGQTGAALGAAAGEDLTAICRGHPLAEAMNLLAMQLLGLIGTFRCHACTSCQNSGRPVGRRLLDTSPKSRDRRSKQTQASFDASVSIA